MQTEWKWLLIGTIVSWSVGMLGADRMYRGQVGLGVLKLLTLGGLGVWYLVDALIWTKKLGEANMGSFIDKISDKVIKAVE